MSKIMSAITTKDISLFKKYKSSPVYKDYIKNIVNTPAYLTMINEHVKHVDVTEDIKNVRDNFQFSPKDINDLFISSIKEIAMNIVADTIILNDIANLSFKDAISDHVEEFKTKYMLGLADEETYQKAKETIVKNKDTSSPLFTGYVEYLKNNDKLINVDFTDILNDIIDEIPEKRIATRKSKPTPRKEMALEVDL